MLRRERVRARDIFRFGTGMVFTPLGMHFVQVRIIYEKFEVVKTA